MSNSESMYGLLQELEKEQVRIANGGTDPVEEKWIPVQRVNMSDEEVDALVEGAEEELETKPGLVGLDSLVLGVPKGEMVVIAAKSKVGKTKLKPVKKTAKTKKAPKKVAAKKVKKIDTAREIYKANKKAERKDVLKLFVKKLKMSPAAASTYYQICKHG